MTLSLSILTLNLGDEDEEGGNGRASHAGCRNSWAARNSVCLELLRRYRPTVICTQQGTKAKLDFLTERFPGYESFNTTLRVAGEEDKDPDSAILYAKEKLEVTSGGTFALSETPSKSGSKSWGAKSVGTATWAVFQVRRAAPPGFAFEVVSTQLDRRSPKAQRHGALLLLQHLTAGAPTLPVVLGGCFGTMKDKTPGALLLGRKRYFGQIGGFRDAWTCARLRKNVLLTHSYHRFRGAKRGVKHTFKNILRTIFVVADPHLDEHEDWIFVRGRQLAANLCEVVPYRRFEDGQFPSSHYPLYAEFLLPRSVTIMAPSAPAAVISAAPVST
eukprot:TRINITY_DN26203_c0_g1_i1.p1 TRINITY_DN26203_c0_g1~~TRINITY_DN26203_c0_g1_i1.p1  ORF type:complete len:330 (-),score=43.97 TRINITY_DN26203_c0_g1_i1:897-1886(-)